MPATAAATAGSIISVALTAFTIFLASSIPADKITGMEIKKENLIDLLKSVRAPLVGCILNGFTHKHNYYGDYNLGLLKF